MITNQLIVAAGTVTSFSSDRFYLQHNLTHASQGMLQYFTSEGDLPVLRELAYDITKTGYFFS
jgi:hypothetical protein